MLGSDGSNDGGGNCKSAAAAVEMAGVATGVAMAAAMAAETTAATRAVSTMNAMTSTATTFS